MELKEKERTLIQDLQTQEQSCVEKYGKYAAQAKDPELKSLFETIQKEEQKHYDTLRLQRYAGKRLRAEGNVWYIG